MREGTYPPDECLSTAGSPKAGNRALCGRTRLWVLGSAVPAEHWASTSTLCLPALGDGDEEQRGKGKGKAAASVSMRCLWGPSHQMQSGFRSLLAD